MAKVLNLASVIDIGSRVTKTINLTKFTKSGKDFTLENLAKSAEEGFLDNVYIKVSDKEDLARHYRTKDETFKTNSDFTLTKASGEENQFANGERFVVGHLARSLTTEYVMPDPDLQKFQQEFAVVNVFSSILNHAYELEKDITAINVRLMVLLPATEAYNNAIVNMFAAKMRGEYFVTLPMSGQRIAVNIELCNIAAEGMTATIPILYDENGLKEEYEFLEDAEALIVDIGENSIDQAIMTNTVIDTGTADSLYYGGSTLRSMFKEELQKTHPTRKADDKTLKTGVEKGYIPNGAQREEVEEQLKASKKRFAKKVHDDDLSYLRNLGKDPRQIAAIIFIGGPNSTVQRKDKSIRDWYMEIYNELAPGTIAITSDHSQVLNVVGAAMLAAEMAEF